MKHLILLLALGLSGCTSTAGPFITRLAVAGPGVLAVERCEVEYSPWGVGSITNTNCSQEYMQLWKPLPLPPPPPPPAAVPPAR